MVPEWANISYLVISDKSVSTIFPNQDEENQFITDFILKACPYVPVLVIISEELRLEKLLCLIRERGELSRVDKGLVKFVFAAHDSKWIRDYGLFFGKDRAGRLYCFDTMYNNIRVGENFEPRPNDEILPQFLLNFIKEQKDSIISVRVPYFLNGGDYYTDGQDTCYISTHSILSNGGNWEEAEAVLKEYFGAEKYIFLHSLPPEIVIPHIDMFFKPVSADVCLLGRYEQENPDYFLNVIQTLCNEILEKNRSLLIESNPKMTIHWVPMPNMEKKAGHPLDDYYRKLTDIIDKNRSVLNAGSKFSLYLDQAYQGESKENNALQETADELLVNIQRMKAESFEKKLLGVSEHHYLTRTYLNSLFINGNKKAVLLPFYKDFDELNQKAYEIYQKVYTSVYGDVDIIPLYSDILIPYSGAIHCITNIIP